MKDRKTLEKLAAVAQGRLPGDTVLKNCRIIDVYNQTIREGDIVFADGWIAGAGGSYEAAEVVDAGGCYAAPGFIDSHIHIESSYLSPEEFGRLVVPCGTTTVITDPHEIVNVCGLAGLDYMMAAAEKTVLDIKFMLPSCVPATGFDHAGAVLLAEDMKDAIQRANVLGLAEFMNYPGVLQAQPEAVDKLAMAQKAGRLIDGHAPGLIGSGLDAYAAMGIATDHECATAEEALARVADGMYVMLRNGSACHDLPRLLPAVSAANMRRFLLCSDDLHAKTVFSKGHLNEHLRLCVQGGLTPEAAITMASLNAAECYHLYDRGALVPGRRADVVLLEDLKEFKSRETWIAGQRVAEAGRYLPAVTRVDYASVGSSVHIDGFSADRLKLKLKGNRVYTIDVSPGSVVTAKGQAEIQRSSDGDFIYSAEQDIVKTAVVERHHGTGNVGVGLLRGYGLKRGAIAVSIAHDSHNIIAAGASNEDMAFAVQTLAGQSGGMAAVLDGQVLAAIPLPIAGLMSDQSAEWLEQQMEIFYDKACHVLGVNPAVDAVMTLCFMSLPVIPSIKLLDTGLFDVEKFGFMDIEVEE